MGKTAVEIAPDNTSYQGGLLAEQPTGRDGQATIFDDSGEWRATKLTPAVVEQ